MGKFDDERVPDLAAFEGLLSERPNVTRVQVDDGGRSPMIVVRYRMWTAVVNPMPINGRYLNVDVHAFSGNAAHKARVIGFPYGSADHLGGGLHMYPMACVIVGEDSE